MNEKTTRLTVNQKARLVSGKNFWRTYGFAEEGVESIIFSDGPAGLRVQSEKRSDSMGLNKSRPATCFPAHSSLACSFNASLAREVGVRIGEEAANFGADVVLGPAINIKRNPLCGRNFEYFSEDPYLSGVLGREYILGVQAAGAGACVKHFCANNKEYGRTVSDSVVDERTLREIYLTPFEMAVKGANPRAVMSAYNRLNGTFCNENKRLLTDILRGEWGYGGIVVSDWGGTYDRVSAIKAGADLEMPGCKFSVEEITQAIRNGTLSEEELDRCADRIVSLAENKIKKEKADFEEHARFAVTCAEECAVLLKNNGVLPVKDGVKYALFGSFAKQPVYQGGGSSHVNPVKLTSLLDCASADKDFAGYARGFKGSKCNKGYIKRALKLAKKADVCVVAVGLFAGDAEGTDRSDIGLPESQIALISALKSAGNKVVAVLSCGGAVETGWDNETDALLLAGLNGQGGSEAVYNILKGKVNPSGKLAETFPERIEDVPSSKYFNENPYYTVYGEGMDVGYRYFRGKDKKYPFGFGLSYTQFEYSDLTLTEAGASFTLKNTGGSDGAEAAQMYIEFPSGANSPVQFKGFSKAFLRAGESKNVFIPFDEYSFRAFDVVLGKWREVGGEYKILIGSSSEDIRLSASVEREGGCAGVPAADTSSLAPKEYALPKDERGRITVDLHTPFSEMKNSRALLVRALSRFALYVTRNNPTVGGTLYYAHVRTGAQFAKFDSVRAEGLVNIFNGKYFKGMWKIIRGRRKKGE